MLILSHQFTAVGLKSNTVSYVKWVQFVCVKIEVFFSNVVQLNCYPLVNAN